MVGIRAPVNKGAAYPLRGLPEIAGIPIGSVLGGCGAIGEGYCVMKETGGKKWPATDAQRPVGEDVVVAAEFSEEALGKYSAASV
jgi:hypothetical protein